MRFEDLQGLTSLPVERVHQRFRNEEMLTVLPVVAEAVGRDTLLVATRFKLAVVIGEAPPSDHWMTHWAPWDQVRFADGEPAEADEADEEGPYRLVVHVGTLTFHARLPGEAGQRALRDFVVAAQARREALASSP